MNLTRAAESETRSDRRLIARNASGAPSRRGKTLIKRLELDDDHGCRQRNSPPPLDRNLIRAVADLDK
jgi:hypothetical protein